MYITVEIEKNAYNGYHVYIYKHWTKGNENFERLLCSLPEVPAHQAIAMKKSVNDLVTKNIIIKGENNVIVFRKK